MREDDEIVEKVNKMNTEFYRAFENLSIDMMDNLWKHDENIVCIHPGWDLFTGWLAIRESWITIFANTEMIKFTITNTKIRTARISSSRAVLPLQIIYFIALFAMYGKRQ